MTYSISGFYQVGPGGAGHRIWSYTSTDAESVVAASGYFDTQSDALAVGDKIECFDSTNTLNYGLRVAAITSGVVTTDSLAGRLEVITLANTITASESGKHFILNTATARIQTLPAPLAGLEFWFHAGATQVTGGNHTIVTASGNIIEGTIGTAETPTTAVSCAAAANTISFVADKAVHGDYVHLFCDGTTWLIEGMCFVQDGMTTTQA